MEKYLKYFRYIAIGGLFLVPFIVLLVSSSLFFPFITGKNFLFRLLVEIVFGCWAVLAIYDKKYRIGKSAVLYFVGAFVLATTLSTIFGVNPFKSFWSNYERMEGLVAFLHLSAYFVALAGILKTEKIWKTFFNVNLGVSVWVSFYGLFQHVGLADIHQGSARLDASLGNASYLAIYAVFNIFFALILFFKENKESFVRWLYPPIIVLETFVLYYTATRGAILGFIGGLFLAGIILTIVSEQKKVKQIGAGAFAGVLLIIGGFWLARNSNFVMSSPVLSRFSTISVNETTTQSRLVIWKMAYEGFKERPILGWGLENFNLIFNKYYEPILWKQETWFDRAHNVFFDRLTTGGIVGLVTYLGLFGSVVFYVLFKRKELGFSVGESSLLVALLAAYFVHNIFVFDNLISSILFFTVLAYVQQRIDNSKEQEVLQVVDHKKNKHSKHENAAKDDYQKSALAIAAIILSIYSVYYVNYKPYAANKTLLRALSEGNYGASENGTKENLQNAFDSFEKAISYNSFGSMEAREHLMTFAIQAIGSDKVDDAFKQKVYQYSVSQMEEQIQNSPNDIRYLVILGYFYNRVGRTDLAIDTMKKAIELSPKKQPLYFELASAYINKKDFDKSIEAIKTAYELDTTNEDAGKIYAVILVRAGKIDEAEKFLAERFGSSVIPDERLASAYAVKNRYDRVVEVYKKLVEAEPANANYMYKLAMAYAGNKQNDLAIKELELMIAADPSFKEQGETIINQLKGVKHQ